MNTILEQLKKHFNNTPRDIIEKEWDEYSKYDDIGPTIDEFLVSLDKSSDWRYEKSKDICTPINSKKTSDYYPEFFFIFASDLNKKTPHE